MVVRSIANLIKWHARVQAAHCFGIAGASTKRDCGSAGVESVQRQLLRSKCTAVTKLAGIRDPWERYKIIQNQRGRSVKIGTITVSKRSRPPAHSSNHGNSCRESGH
jgi:hypothetical protein